MREATMLYRSPGSHELHGVMVDYVTVDASSVPEMLMDGWHLTPLEAADAAVTAHAAANPPSEAFVDLMEDSAAMNYDAPPTRSELEAKALELGIRFDGRTSDKKLGALIAASLETS